MILRIIIFFLLLLRAQSILACGCGGPINSIEIDIDSSDAIFIGIITEINEEHKFHLADQIGNGLKYINFDVYRSNKGLNKAQLKVAVFDFMSNSSCEGLNYGKQVGDTILVFANEFKPEMLGSYLCGRHPNLANLSIEELNFKDTATWNDPRSKYKNVNEYISKQFPGTEQVNKSTDPMTREKNPLLYLSLAFNLILVLYLVLKRNKKR